MGLLLARRLTTLGLMNGNRTLRVVQLALKVNGVVVGFAFALLGAFRNVIAATDSATRQDDTLGSSIRGGDLNFRTGKFDDGTDPAGWYGRD